jgi:hypothetical protein
MKANVLKIYVNGVEDTNPTAVLGTNLYTSVGTTKNFSIGCTASTTTANEKHNGNMDDFTYWTVAKTDKEVSDLMNGTLVGTEANLAFLLDYENNLTDKSPVANVLVNTGITYAATTLSRTQAQNITFNALSAINTSDADVALTATASSTLAVQYTSSNTAVATIVAGKIHPVGVGTATITAYQPGDQTTSYAESTQLLTVNAVITSANAADDADVTVKVVNNKLEVTGAEAAVRAFTATGAEVDATKALKAGIYIVKVAGKTVKVSVR